MKVIIRLASVILLIAGIITVSHAQQSIHVAGGDYLVTGSVTSNNLDAHLSIENTSTSDMSILVSRDNSSLLNGHASYFCWFQCYDTVVSLSPDPLVVPARTTDDLSFHGYIYPLGVSGTSVVTYTFFDMNNPGDTAVASITYDVLNTGIEEIGSKISLSNASPNPANNMTSISYNLPELNNAHLIFYNMLGNTVKDFKLTSPQMLKLITIGDLPSGVYVYSLINNGKSLLTKKLIVAHR